MSQEPIPGLKTRTVAVGHRELYVSELGDGYPVLMLHGGGPGASGLSNYSRNIEALARDFRVIVPDMQGYGQSTKGLDRGDVFGDLAAGMLELLDALEVSRAYVVGNSLGGGCALRMALDQPERVSAMVLMGPGGINTTRGLPTRGLKKLLNYYKGEGPSKEKLREFICDFLVYDSSQIPEELIDIRYAASIDPDVVANPPLRGPSSLGAALRMDFTRDKRLRDCSVPTLVLWGTEDRVNRHSGGETLQELMPHCDLYLFSNTGHWVQWERADEFNTTVSGFLRRQAAPANPIQGETQ